MLISSTERIELKVYLSFSGIILFAFGLFILTLGIYFLASFIFFISFLLLFYAYNLCKVEVIGDKLRITRNKLTIETPIHNIKKVNYRLFMLPILTEPHIRIKLKEKTKFGRSISFSPSNLTENNEFKFNRKIKNYLECKIEEIKNTQKTS